MTCRSLSFLVKSDTGMLNRERTRTKLGCVTVKDRFLWINLGCPAEYDNGIQYARWQAYMIHFGLSVTPTQPMVTIICFRHPLFWWEDCMHYTHVRRFCASWYNTRLTGLKDNEFVIFGASSNLFPRKNISVAEQNVLGRKVGWKSPLRITCNYRAP